jgi:signal transduction histidine kinase
MPDYYHAPALILTALLLPAFAYLYHRFRDIRTLLWLSGFSCSIISMVLLFTMSGRGLSGEIYPWLAAAGQSALLVGSALFLGSLSPLGFKLGRFRVLYVVPYTIPLVVYSVLLYGRWSGNAPPVPRLLLFPFLAFIAYVVAMFWGAKHCALPLRVGILLNLVFGGLGFWALIVFGPAGGLTLIESANFLITAVLLIVVFRRFSTGVVLSALGFIAWSLPAIRLIPPIHNSPSLDLHLAQIITMAKVVAAIGMLALTLEDELALNKAAQGRERRARRELEAYTRLVLARRHLEDFDRQGNEICETIAAQSRFSQVALLLHSAGRYRLAGAAGFDAPLQRALDELASRLPATGFLAPGSAPPAVDYSQTVQLSLEPWLWPGDDLKRLGLTSVLAVPMVNRSVIEGALLLSGIRPLLERVVGEDPNAIRPDDLLPIEMLVGRVQATRSQTIIFEKLIDSEKFGHLGQLATSVTQQLNNPLTVILGYASLLEGTANLDPQDRKAVESILTEARHMRSTLESLSRIARPQTDSRIAVSVAELLADLGELHRPEFLQRAIEFRVSLAPDLPRVLCSAPQLRQAVRHCLQFAMEAVENSTTAVDEPRTIRLEAASEGNLVQIMVAHSGPGFDIPERAFDPFIPAQAGTHSSSLGLSLCATVMRDNNGRASAMNFEPSGAAIVLELKAA